MIFSGILKRLFKRKNKVVVLNREKLMNRSGMHSNKAKTDTSIFEIMHTFSLKEQGTIISGKIKRGFF